MLVIFVAEEAIFKYNFNIIMKLLPTIKCDITPDSAVTTLSLVLPGNPLLRNVMAPFGATPTRYFTDRKCL